MSVKEIFVLLDAMKKRPNVACFIISVLFLIVMLLELQGAVVSKDYLPVTGEICNIEKHREYKGRHKETRYDYDVVWEIDGAEYTYHFKDELERKDPGTVNIWINSDNTDVRFSSSEDVQRKAPYYLLISIVTGLLGCFFQIRKRKQLLHMSEEELDEYLDVTEQIAGLAAVIFLVALIFSAYVLYQQGMLQSMTIYQVLVFVVYAVSFAVSFGVFIYAYRKTDG